MNNVQIYNDWVDIKINSQNNLKLFFTKDTGKIFYRLKINTISQVRHTGIILGRDITGINWFMHNHYEHGRPVIENEQGFAKGQPLFVAERQATLDGRVVIQKAFIEISKGQRYHWLDYNCQTFVNKICFNEERSEAVENWTGGVLTGLLIFVGVAAFNNSK